MNLLKSPAQLITGFNEKVAFVASLLIYGIIAVVVIEVGGRYIFNSPTNWSYDMQWMLCGALMVLGGAYGLKEEVHVKADVFYDMFPPRVQAIVRIICYLVFFFPFAIPFAYVSYDLMVNAWVLGETSPYTSWNPSTGPIKTVMFLGALMLLLQGLLDFIGYFKKLKDGGDSVES